MTNPRQLLVEIEVGREQGVEEAVHDVDLLGPALEGDVDAGAQRWARQDQVVAQGSLARVLDERLDVVGLSGFGRDLDLADTLEVLRDGRRDGIDALL